MQINRWYGGEDGAHAVRGKTKIADEKYSNVQILFGGNRGKKQLEQMAADSREEFWHVPKLMAAGDMVLFYIDRPTSAIIAIGRTLSRPRATKLKWYEAKVGKVRLLDAPIKLAELREMFPGWTWLLRPRQFAYVTPERARALLKRCELKSPPLAIEATLGSGAGFYHGAHRLGCSAGLRWAGLELNLPPFPSTGWARERPGLGPRTAIQSISRQSPAFDNVAQFGDLLALEH